MKVVKNDRLGSGNICLSCGLCCNGVIFRDVRLLPDEDSAELLNLGIPLLRSDSTKNQNGAKGSEAGAWQFPQPCVALDGCRCRIYSSRPKYCRQFDCALLKNVLRGSVTKQEALKLIRVARRQAEKVRSLLRSLGETEETLALKERFRRIARRLEKSAPDGKVAGLYARVTVAFHELSVTLQRWFYPGDAED